LRLKKELRILFKKIFQK